MTQHAAFFWSAIAIGLLAGCMLGTQPSVNGFLARHLAHPLQASTISFVTGTILLVGLTVVMGHFPPRLNVPVQAMPWWTWIGGAIGVVMVTSSLYFVPRIGSLNWIAAVITGQVVAALILDQFGLLGNLRQPASALRLVGTVLMVLGILCITYSRRPNDSIDRKSALQSDTLFSPTVTPAVLVPVEIERGNPEAPSPGASE